MPAPADGDDALNPFLAGDGASGDDELPSLEAVEDDDAGDEVAEPVVADATAEPAER
jgi:hypothetical protein